MILTKALNIFKNLCMTGYYVGAFPYKWDTFGQYVRTKSKVKLFHWIFICAYTAFNAGFMAVRLAQAWCCMPTVTVGKLFINFFSVTTFTTTALAHLNTVIYHDEFLLFINELLRFNEFFKQSFKDYSTLDDIKSQTTKSKIKEVINVLKIRTTKNVGHFSNHDSKVMLPMNIINVQHGGHRKNSKVNNHHSSGRHRQLPHPIEFDIAHWMHTPSEDSTVAFMHRIIVPIYLYSVSQFFIAYKTVGINPKYVYTLFDINNKPKLLRIIAAALEFYFSITAATTMLVYLMIFVLYIRSSRDGLAKLSQPSSTNSTTGDFRRISKHYRTLQLLNLLFSTIFRTIPTPGLVGTALLVFVVSNYATLKLTQEVRMPAALGFPVVSFGMVAIAYEVFPNSYHICRNSIKLLRLVRKKACSRKNYIWKFVTSCKPLHVYVGSYFIIQRDTVLTYMGIAFNITFQILLL